MNTTWEYAFVGVFLPKLVVATTLDEALVKIRKDFPDAELKYIKYLAY